MRIASRAQLEDGRATIASFSIFVPIAEVLAPSRAHMMVRIHNCKRNDNHVLLLGLDTTQSRR